MNPSDQLKRDLQKLQEDAKKIGFGVVDRSVLGLKEKISSLILEMVYPLFYEAKNEEDARGIISMGVAAWNCGILKMTKGEAELHKALQYFDSKGKPEHKKLLEEYINIKCTKYVQNNENIINFEVSFEKNGHVNFSVVTEVTKK